MFSGNELRLEPVRQSNGLVELSFDMQRSSVNKIDAALLAELEAAVRRLEQDPSIRGLMITSAKPAFVVGADVFAFPTLFEGEPGELADWLAQTHDLFNRLETLPFPTVAAVNGFALGGGFEIALTADARVVAKSTKVGLPEVNLGLCPGWGGTVRASRLSGVVPSLDLMISGKPVAAQQAVELGLAEQCVDLAELRDAALALLNKLADGELDPAQYRVRKRAAVKEGAECDGDRLRRRYAKRFDSNYPAASEIIDAVLSHAQMPFEEALAVERAAFTRLGMTTTTAKSLVGLFINEQRVKQTVKRYASSGKPVGKGAVLGAGIMGGGIAYQSAVTGTPVLLKDIRQEALDLGIATATTALDKLVEKGRLDAAGQRACLEQIAPTLDFAGFGDVDLVVEAVVENEPVKAAVLRETEAQLSEGAVLTSNTSTISITALAKHLQCPQRFCGMHFFNPVPLMPLVEVIRGEQSDDTAVATAVAYAAKMGKTPIVVNDCPGFLVNRVLFPYFNAFNRLLHDGIDFQRIDRVMEAFGWPMGPAYLADVVGLDTMMHADQVMQQGYPERMGHDHRPIVEDLVEQGALGQKNGRGFYDYSAGPRNKVPSTDTLELLAAHVKARVEITDQQIIDRMMIPMCLEAFLCLDEGIVGSPAEVDMGLIMGIGFPKFRGGALRYIDHLGHAEFAARVESLSDLGPLYQVPESFRLRLLAGKSFF